jgi:hypothetical protein
LCQSETSLNEKISELKFILYFFFDLLYCKPDNSLCIMWCQITLDCMQASIFLQYSIRCFMIFWIKPVSSLLLLLFFFAFTMAAMGQEPPYPPPEPNRRGPWKDWSPNGSRPCRKCRRGEYFWKIGCNNPQCVA